MSILLLKKQFTPRQLFAAMQGAWLEPIIGNMWQENTGVTPVSAPTQTVGKLLDMSGGSNNATQATAANRPTYQLDANNLPLIRHDTTDYLTASLPAVNVRRNLLTYSEDFSQWGNIANVTREYGYSGPIGLANAVKVSATASTSTAFSRQVSSVANANNGFTFSAVVKKGSGATDANKFMIYNSTTTTVLLSISVNYDTLDITYVTGSTGASIEQVGNGFIRVILTVTSGISDGNTITNYIFFRSQPETAGEYAYAASAQFENGTTATDYQKVTNWTNEAYASSGSVYFATPQGMSCLHNQSMATTYNLPALSTDVYAWCVFPQRLNMTQEAQLERYFMRKAGIATPDYMTDENGNILTDELDIPLLAG